MTSKREQFYKRRIAELEKQVAELLKANEQLVRENAELTEWVLFKWLNRKSQRRAYTWPSFHQALACVGWPTGSIRKALNPCRRTEAY